MDYETDDLLGNEMELLEDDLYGADNDNDYDFIDYDLDIALEFGDDTDNIVPNVSKAEVLETQRDLEREHSKPDLTIAEIAMEEIQRLSKSIREEDRVKIAFQQSAGQFWGKIGTVRVQSTKEAKGGTKYFLVVADIIKNGERLKLIQEWFIGRDGTAKPAPKKNITIPDDYADEISLMISDEFKC